MKRNEKSIAKVALPALDYIKSALIEAETSQKSPNHFVLTHILSPNVATDFGDPGEVNLLADVVGEPDYFDLMGLEERLGARLGLSVRIYTQRAISTHWLPIVTREMVVL